MPRLPTPLASWGIGQTASVIRDPAGRPGASTQRPQMQRPGPTGSLPEAAAFSTVTRTVTVAQCHCAVVTVTGVRVSDGDPDAASPDRDRQSESPPPPALQWRHPDSEPAGQCAIAPDFGQPMASGLPT
jgi:hypothetical protein